MKRPKYRLLASGLLILVAMTLTGYSQSKSTTSSAVNSIFISEKFPDDWVRFNTGEFQRSLKRLLKAGGIQTSDSASDADAELTVEIGVMVTLDGSVEDKDVMIYECKLVTKFGKEVWRVKQTFVTKANQSENDVFASKRVAEKLLSAWKRGKLKSS